MKLIIYLKHKLAHFLGWNKGNVETWICENALYVGFRCSGCGKLLSVEKSREL